MDNVRSIDRLWTAEETAGFLGVPLKTLYQWRWKGTGPRGRKVGRHLRFDPAVVRAWVAADEVA
ncbi:MULTISPECIES: AlpA family transcriptional regulator [unclassified Crossiella]|uniref:helix-turn-helix transcriptional regulator n=1 Tax=unclassified Crossiella TaxID=2620835 RepID=UPI002000271C|nr:MULTISPECIES: helix-turn-helix domain-containing protein [unclassified Crossiella]MCK2237819.1 helix-turn-helix domain-containing protein [Crossiella sp. S99.2]MCK2255105.1 helix-turn-helix domain-containing protein [Crossiella sp. S99.1]